MVGKAVCLFQPIMFIVVILETNIFFLLIKKPMLHYTSSINWISLITTDPQVSLSIILNRKCFDFITAPVPDDKEISPEERSLMKKMIRDHLANVKGDVNVQQKDPNSPLFSVKSFEELRLWVFCTVLYLKENFVIWKCIHCTVLNLWFLFPNHMRIIWFVNQNPFEFNSCYTFFRDSFACFSYCLPFEVGPVFNPYPIVSNFFF